MKITKLSEQVSTMMEKATYDPWANTVFAGWKTLHNSTKGAIGEQLIEEFFTSKNSVVTPRSDAGHDRIIDGFRTEIKFSLAVNAKTGQNEPIFNHISLEKSWDILILCYVDINDMTLKGCWAFKEDFKDFFHMLKKQQGGKKSDNDDFMIGGMRYYREVFESGYFGDLNDL